MGLTNTGEVLLEPLPGSRLVVVGEVSLPWRQYVKAAAANQLPPIMRVRQLFEAYEHTIAPCEDHVMVPAGQRAVTWRELKERFLDPGYKYFPQATHLHEVVRVIDGQMIRWSCLLCSQWGFEAYTIDTLAATTHLVTHRCVKCSAPRWKPQLDRRTFIRWGLGAGLGYSAWIANFPPLKEYPFVPPAWGVPTTFYVDFLNGNDTTGTGTSGAPWKTIEKGRQALAARGANNGDTLLARGTDGTTSTYYPEAFGPSTLFPAGNADNNRTVIAADTGHTPVIRSLAAGAGSFGCIIHTNTSAQQYLHFRGLVLDGVNLTNNEADCYRLDASTTDTPSTAAHHMRIQTSTLRNNDIGSLSQGVFYDSGPHDNEIISCTLRDNGPAGNTLCHGTYIGGPDNLTQGCDAFGNSGNGYQEFASASSDIGDRNVLRKNRGRSNGASGIFFGNGTSKLAYYNRVEDNSTSGMSIRSSGGNSVVNSFVLNNTSVANAVNGFTHTSGATGTTLKNNIAFSNGTNFANTGGTITSNTNNTWNLSITDPLFTDFAARNLHLQTGSPCKDVGANVASTINSGTWALTPLTDTDGVSVPQGLATDLGAFEIPTTIAVLSRSPATLTYVASQGGSNPAAQPITITDTASTGTMSWSITDTATWLTVSSSSGIGDAVVTASVNISGLTAAVYNATITITAPGATGSPATVAVTLTVLPTASPGHRHGGRFR